MPGPTNEALKDLTPERVFISGRQDRGSRHTNRRLQRYRTGKEAGSATSNPLRDGPQPPEGHRGPADLDRVGILAYNADTLAVRVQ